MKVLIIGGVAGGASTAARLRRLDEQAEIIMFEKGDYISYASCGLPYYVSDVIAEQENLVVMTPQKFNDLMNVDVRVKSEVVEIDRQNKKLKVKNLTTNEVYEENYDKLVLSPGAKPFVPNIEGLDASNVFTLRTVNDIEKIKEAVRRKEVKTAAVIGGGFIGIEMAENLVETGLQTALIEMSNQLLAPVDYEISAQMTNHMRDKGVDVRLESAAQRVSGNKVVLHNGDVIEADVVICAIGVVPETSLAKEAGIELGPRGHILVDEYLKTNDKDIYALGDAIEVVDFVSGDKTAVPLAGPANRQGRIVADNIAGINSSYKGTQGTSILKVFDLTVASTGLNEKQLKSKGIDYSKTYVHGFSHASYYPKAFPITIKLLFAKDNGKVLGAQAIGADGVDKRMDVIATTLRLGGGINDLADLELSYAPPFGSAKDPVNIAGMSAQNIINGMAKPIYWDEIEHYQDAVWLDVRTEIEAQLGQFEGSTFIPLEELRARLGELPKDKKIVVYCTKGLKSYFAARILQQNGFEDVYTLNGGYIIYKSLKAASVPKKNYGIGVMKENIKNIENTIKIDASGLSCPGPIMKLAAQTESVADGQVIEISTTDSGFKNDIKAWCESTGNTLLDLKEEDKIFTAFIQKGQSQENMVLTDKTKRQQTIVVFSNDLDKVMASFIIANGAVAQGMDVSMFFTFWGLNVLRKDNVSVKKGLLDTMFGFMMPKGASKLILSKMHMGGAGTQMMKHVMQSKNVPSLPDLIQMAQKNNIKFIACQMAMDVMGITKEELLDGVDVGGVATYLNEARNSSSNLFI